MAATPRQTLADYVTIAISPALIIAMMVSLLYFLVTVLYQGQYEGRLEWILFWFVLGTVLISRISIEISVRSAQMYGLLLGGVIMLALPAFVTFEGPLADFGYVINAVLMVIIWWCAHKLTYDCTVIDDSVDASAQGLMGAAGLDGTTGGLEGDEETGERGDGEKKKSRKNKRGFRAWWRRYRSFRNERQRRANTPGVWVVYFSLAALPLYGLGQSLIPPSDLARRQYSFWLMGCYVASGLGLLLTTSFLGLRRYLRQRKLRMPVAMTSMWLGLGGVLVIILIVAGAIMPRPNSEYPITELISKAGSKDKDASKYAVKRDSAGKGEGSASKENQPNDRDAKPGDGKQKSDEGKTRDNPDASKSENKSDGKQSQSSGKGDKQEQQKSDQKSSQSQSNQNKSDQKGESSKGESSSNSDSGSEKPSSSMLEPLANLMSTIGPILKLIIYIIAAVVAVYVILRYLANFTGWAKGLLDALKALFDGLFGRKSGPAEEETAAEETAPTMIPPRPFADFRNPFAYGSSASRSPEELVRYSFEALQAWAYERDLARQPDETPLEFASRIGENVPAVAANVEQLANYYAQACYSRARLNNSCLAPLKQFWQRLTAVAEDRIAVQVEE